MWIVSGPSAMTEDQIVLLFLAGMALMSLAVWLYEDYHDRDHASPL